MPATIHFDVLAGAHLHGWAARVGGDEPDDDQIRVKLALGGADVGEVARRIVRGDVDAHAGYVSVPKGFAFPVLPFLLFQALNGGSAVLPLELAAEPDAVRVPLDLLTEEALLRASPLSMQECRITDVWFSGEHDLRLKVEPDAPSGVMLNAYQLVFEPQKHLALVGQQVLESDISFPNFVLHNAFLPVLLVLTDLQGHIVSADVLPFPSLARGGNHHVELRSLRRHADDLSDLVELSSKMLTRFVGDPNTAPRGLGVVSIAPDGATGNEQVFGTDVLEWLGHFCGIAVRLGVPTSGAVEADVLAYLSSLLAERSVPVHSSRPDEVSIPADGLPTLSSLIWRSGASQAGPTARPVIVHHTGERDEAWLVAVPRCGAWLVDMQPPGLPPFAVLAAAGGARKGVEPVFSPAAVIRRVETPTQRGVSEFFPVAEDIKPGRAGEGRTSTPPLSVSVCLAVTHASREWSLLLESIARQAGLAEIEVVAAFPRSLAGELAEPFADEARRLFGDRYRAVSPDVPGNAAALMNAAAGAAACSMVLFCARQIVLQNRWTLGMLARMAAAAKVASASCQLVKPAARGFEFACAGYFLTGLNLIVPPGLAFEAFDCSQALAHATYPVCANPAVLLMADRERFLGLGGFDETMFESQGFEIDYGLRAIEAGLFNMNTTFVTAYATEFNSPGRLDIDVLNRYPQLDLRKYGQMATSLRKIL